MDRILHWNDDSPVNTNKRYGNPTRLQWCEVDFVHPPARRSSESRPARRSSWPGDRIPRREPVLFDLSGSSRGKRPEGPAVNP